MSRRGGGGGRVAEYEEDYYRREPAREVLREPPVQTRTREYEETDTYRREPVREVFREPPVQTRTREYEEVDTYQRRGPESNRPDFLRDEYRREDQGPLVLREREKETFTRPVERPVERERSRVRTRIVERSPTPPPVERVRTRVVERERQRSPTPPVERVRTRVVERERSPSPRLDFRRVKISERERSPSPDRSQLRMRVVERVEKAREPSPEPLPPPPPQIYIEKPPIHQDIITHHRHIDHGFERAVTPAPPPPPPAPRRRERDREETEIDISTNRGQTKIDIYKNTKSSRPRNNDSLEVYDDDILFERERDSKISRTKETSLSRRRSLSSRPRAESSWEADYYNSRADERGYIGEAYNGATKDWSIVDVPPGTERVRMDGVGGGSQEITWQRYNGVRRSKFIPERESGRERDVEKVLDVEIRDRERGGTTYEYEREEVTDRRVGRPLERRRGDEMWTEITKDLVVREAIEQMGYEFEETEYFYYIIQYLRYEDVLQLVDLSEEIRRERQKRLRELQYEREFLEERREREIEERRRWERRERELAREVPYEDERIIEREVVYDSRRGGGREYLR